MKKLVALFVLLNISLSLDAQIVTSYEEIGRAHV